MKPYYQDDAVTIYHGDNREILPELGKFDLLLTDPPYGLGDIWGKKTEHNNLENFNSGKLRQGRDDWQKGLKLQAAQWDQSPAEMELINNIISMCGISIIWGGNYYPLPVSRCWLSWDKAQKMAQLSDFELAWTSMDRVCKSHTEIRNPDGKREHPTAKPISLMKFCIRQADGGNKTPCLTILDPFAGSGTTGRAAKDLGRKAVLIEREEIYCEVAAKRMAQEMLFS